MNAILICAFTHRMIITSWKRTVRDGKDGVLYLVTNEDEGNHSDEGKWVSGDVISNKKMLQDFWNIQFGKVVFVCHHPRFYLDILGQNWRHLP